MRPILIKNANIVNEGKIFKGHLFCNNGRIEKIFQEDNDDYKKRYPEVILLEAEGKTLLPGIIDDQVHFREPGLTHKADIGTESKAAVAGGITSYMEMPNTIPPATTNSLINEKIEIAKRSSFANYSFYLGATNDNIEELKQADPRTICGIKVFMGSSTGNMLVDNEKALRSIFSEIKLPVAVHCEDETTIRRNLKAFQKQYGEEIPVNMHPSIRSEEACYLSSSYAVKLAREYGTRLHVLHISTKKELELFDTLKSAAEKHITAEVCVHHLWFDQDDYNRLGSRIKWNPAIKAREDRNALLRALNEGQLDVIATDHAPHTIEEKSNNYSNSPSGGPMVQHSLPAVIELVKRGHLSIEMMVDKMCHTPARIFDIADRGFVKEGYYADLVLLDMDSSWTVSKDNLLYKCGWSPMEGVTFSSKITHTIVSGHIAYENGILNEQPHGKQLIFKR
jgi:dihydroorotase